MCEVCGEQRDPAVRCAASRADRFVTAVAESSTTAPRPTAWGAVRAYVALTKPRVIEQLLVTAVPPMLLAAGGLPSLWLIGATLVGGMLSAGSANSLNCYVDRDIDAVMGRTRNRPLVAHTVSPRAALIFGLVLGVVSTVFLWFATTPLAAMLALTTIAFYVLVYTMLLKRRTPQNIVWGGAAGCMPVLIGWAAVTGSLDWPVLPMFAVIFFWTPPHFWALAMRFKKDYAAAGVPMLPVVASERTVTLQMLLHTWLMVLSSLALWPLATTWVYGGAAVVLGAWFLLEAHLLYIRTSRGEKTKPMRIFHLSNTYLCLLFIAVAVDVFVAN